MNALDPTASAATDSMSGRAASRFSSRASTTSSVIFVAIRPRTLSSRSASVARFANWSESSTARLA